MTKFYGTRYQSGYFPKLAKRGVVFTARVHRIFWEGTHSKSKQLFFLAISGTMYRTPAMLFIIYLLIDM